MQYVFDFYGPYPRRPERPERLFFALLPGQALFTIEQFARRFLLEYQWLDAVLKTNRWHVSLQHIGDYKRLREKFIFGARNAAESIAMPPFDVTSSPSRPSRALRRETAGLDGGLSSLSATGPL